MMYNSYYKDVVYPKSVALDIIELKKKIKTRTHNRRKNKASRKARRKNR